jgi:hypothetical protein
MTRTRKIMFAIGGALLTMVLGFCSYNSWAEWHYKQYGGFEAAGIDPIPGAELIFYKDEPNGFLPDYETTWIYKIPSSYTDNLYKDCSVMHYKTGVVIGYEKDGTERIDPKMPGCHNEPGFHRDITTVQFSGDQLTIDDSYSG